MPTYGYRCTKCANEFDVFQKMSDKPVTDCPKCGGPVKRVFHPVGIIFKGSGFYTTDYKKKSAHPAPAETKAGSGAGGNTEKTESKEPAKTGPAKPPLEKAAK